jgi:hypothetical protein
VRELRGRCDVCPCSGEVQVFSECRRTAGANDNVDVRVVLAYLLRRQLLVLRALFDLTCEAAPCLFCKGECFDEETIWDLMMLSDVEF